MQLYDYWRSSAAYRVRIALNLKGMDYAQIPVDLRAGQQRDKGYLELNPQGLVPFMRDGDVGLGQSLAIIEYLEERHPEPPLLPEDPERRAAARAIALLIACEIHPLNNLRVLQHLERALECDESVRMAWYRHWIAEGFGALESMLPKTAGEFCVGDRPTIADVCLVPQVYNARRYHCDIEPYRTIRRIDEHCRALDPFARAAPDRQPDAARPR